jgi:hypothetical protein
MRKSGLKIDRIEPPSASNDIKKNKEEESKDAIEKAQAYYLRAKNIPSQPRILHPLLLLDLLRLRDPEHPVKRHRGRDIENDIYPQEAKMPPTILKVDINSAQVLVRAVQLAEVAIRWIYTSLCTQIPHVAPSHSNVGVKILGASLIRRGRKFLELILGAVRGCITDGRCHQT